MSNYPNAFDDDTNLYLVKDALRLRLVEDYNLGDTSITVETNEIIMNRFPPTGIITLTEQCSDIDERAISFNYTSKTSNTFDGLTLRSGFTDNQKLKRITNVTLNVMADHHNNLKDALIEVQKFIGVKGDTADAPLEGTVEARTTFLRNIVFKPKAWFTANRTVGVIPLCLNLTEFSTREPNVWIWGFGDGTSSIISRSSFVTNGNISKCYFTPGIFNLTLTVENDFGIDVLEVPDYINARVEAPNLATITFSPTTSQILSGGVLRSRTNSLITTMVNSSGAQINDPIISYTWDFGDDLTHENSNEAKASYSIGGVYDIKLRTDTELGAYRITTFTNVLDIVEKFNIWHFIFDPNTTANAITKDLYVYEFNLISETYKTITGPTTSVTRNYNFLIGQPEETRQVREFRRNNGFAPRSLVASGDRGTSMVFWAEGANTGSDPQVIRFREYNAFDRVWITPLLGSGNDTITRRWNWFSLSSPTNIHFLLGNTTSIGSLTNQTVTSLAMLDFSIANATLTPGDYLNGADELQINVGGGVDGDFSVYRATWQDNAGFWARNDGTGAFFRLKSFYRTEGTTFDPIQSIRKLPDMTGNTKLEGEFVPLSTGVFFFDNTGEVIIYNPVTNVWTRGGPGVNSPLFTAVQDTSVPGFSDAANTLVATGDSNHNAYLSFDYSTRAVLKFNEIDKTFSTLPVRPSGEQFLMGLY